MTGEPALAQASLYSSHPTIEVDGQGQPMVEQLLQSLDLVEDEGGMSSLELRVVNVAVMERGGADYAFEYSDADILALGNSVRVSLGDRNDPQEVFRGAITGLEFSAKTSRSPELVVLAEDSLQRARMARRTRLHRDVSVADLVQNVASGLGLRATVDGLTGNSGTEMQLNESDLAFLRRLLERHDADLQVVGDELQVSPRSEVRRGEVTLEYASQLLEVRALADLAHQATEVTFAGWDAAQGADVQVTSSRGGLGPGSGRRGDQFLDDGIGERPEHLGSGAARDEAEAQALVNARYTQRARQFVRLKGCAEGNPALRVGTHATVRGLGPRFDNTYYLTRARHRYDRRDGYRTEFEAQCAYFGG